LQTPGEIVDVNFGQQPFMFDIEAKKQELKSQVIRNIENFSTTNTDTNWQSILQRVVSGYLVHYGYSSTADCFAKSTGQSISEEISSVRNRQRIQKLILAGRISEAIETTQTLYPTLFDRNPKLYFQLKCRQFIEMVNGCDGEIKPMAHSPTRSTRNSPCSSPARTLSHSSSTGSSTTSNNSQNGFNTENTEQLNDIKNGVDNNGHCDELSSTNDMLVDGYVGNGSSANTYTHTGEERTKMDTSDEPCSSISNVTINPNIPPPKAADTGPSLRQLCGGNIFAIEKLITYGKSLQATYKNLVKEIGENEENEIFMKEAFSLLAYSNPRDSSVGYLLDPSQRETLSTSLNSAILEAQNLPGQPALELTIAQSKACLKTMAKNDIAASSLIKVENFFSES